MLNGKRILVTGGVGFLGMHLVKGLLNKGAVVRSYDLSEEGVLEKGLGEVEFMQGDIRHVERLKKACDGIDMIIHAAAALPLWKKEDIFSTNVDGTKYLLHLAEVMSIERVVYVSSTAVYGVPKKHPIVESDRKVGVGAYGESKIQAEKVCHEFREKGICVPVVRPKTFIGTGRLGVFQILFDWVQKGARIPIIGSGQNRYQLLDVRDLVDSILLLAEGDREVVNDDFNVGAAHFGTVREDVSALCEVAGNGAKVLPTPALPVKFALRLLETMNLSPLYQWVYDTADKDSFVSIEKIQSLLGWRPNYSNRDTLIDTYQWYLRNFRQEYRGGIGVTHRVAWEQGALKVARWMLGGRGERSKV